MMEIQMCDIQFWATIASPIIGVVAIIVALIVSHCSSRDAQRQIEVFMAAQAPDMLDALDKYQRQLEQLDMQIKEAQQKYDIVNPFFGQGGAPIEDIRDLQDKKSQALNLNQLKSQREKIEKRIHLIKSFLAYE